MATKINRTEIESYVISRVKKMREEANLSQAQLAAELGVSYGFIGSVESSNQRAKYNLNHLNKLVIILKCEFKDFFPDNPL